MDNEDRRLIGNTPIFGGLKDSTIDFLIGDFEPVRRAAGEVFFREDEPGHSVFVMRAGRVTVGKDWKNSHVVLRELKRGDCFGEMALLDQESRSATVTAYDDSAAFEIPLIRLQQLYDRDLEQYLAIHMNMARIVSERLRSADDRLFELAMDSSDEGYERLFLCI
ncbi:MAG: Crp/Fnr family transcriptional regulator [Gammaproteobacteria bacterium]